MFSRSASLHCKPRIPSLQINLPPLRHFLPQHPKWTHPLLRHHVTCRVLENSGKGMVRVMVLSLSVTPSPSVTGSVDQ